jgi:hypothetical protein
MGKQLTDNYIISKYGVELENPTNDISNKLKNLYGA